MLSAVSAQGALRFMVHDGTVNAKVFVDFCKRLLTDAKGPVYLIVDGHPSHRAKAVAEFVASTDGRLRLFFLPGYPPELNPDEWVWKNWRASHFPDCGPNRVRSGKDERNCQENTRNTSRSFV